MTIAAHSLAGMALMTLTVSASCGSTPETQSAETARRASEVAVSASQKQLWQEVADRGAAQGLERVPSVQQPVERRERRLLPPGGQAPPNQQPSIAIPPRVDSAIRILVHPAMPTTSYTGVAKVSEVAADRMRLDLGDGRMLTVLARAGGESLPVAGAPVTVAYQSRKDPWVPADVIAIQTRTGHGIAQVIQGGNGPVMVTVPLFGVTVSQTDDAAVPAVAIRAGGAFAANVPVGSRVQVGDVMALVIGSSGAPKGADVGQIGGSPFVLNVLVWKVP